MELPGGSNNGGGMEQQVFDAWWPEAANRMRATLLRRGVTPNDIDDVVQATAEKALRSTAQFESQSHFTQWCLTTGKRVSIDVWRRTRREDLGPVPHRATHDAADQAIARLDLALVSEHVDQLPTAQRAALLLVDPIGDRRTALRVARARHAAREKLRRVVDGTAAAFGGRLGLRLREFAESSAGAATAAGVAVALAFGASVALPRDPTPDSIAAPPFASAAPAPPAVAQGLAAKTAASSTGLTPPAQSATSGRRGGGSVVPAFSIPLGQNADGTQRSIDAGPSEKDQPLACIGSTLASEGFCTDPPIPSIDETLGTDLL